MSTPDKATIYIDIDDEITGIIDKVRSSEAKIVALVLPKRASVFQSIVNMKLLKRAASDANKDLVLVTTESGLMPLAGAAGLYVASSATAKPSIPSAPAAPSDVEETVEELDDDLDEVTADNAGDKAVGALAAAAVIKGDEMETVELDNEVPDEPLTPSSPKQPKKNKKLQVPNFERFRTWLIIGGIALVALIIGLIFALKVMPKATISIDTDARSVSIDENVKLSTTAKSVHLSDGTLPAKLAKQDKTYTETVPATGQKNNGNKAEGSVTLSTGCISSFPSELPAGSGVSSGGKTYITQETTDFSSNSTTSGCPLFKAKFTAEVNIVAQSGGASYNVNNASFSASNGSTGTGKATGGTDNIVTIVTEGDINAAKAKINTSDPTVKKALENDLKNENYYPITATFSAGTPAVTTSAKAGDAASNVTVTEAVSYTMFGIKKDDLKELIAHSAKAQIDTSKQSILDDGVDGAVFNVTSQTDKDAELSLHTEVSAGPQLDIATIKEQSAGKKSGDVKAEIGSNPDVTNVDVKLSPFWVTSVPKNTSKITVIIAKPKPVSNQNDAN